jgi:aspartyl aminopeptidase
LEGFNMIGAHVDSPRLDLKPNPMYESDDLTLLKTHYYGGIKKYQWAATALSLHGVVILKDGTTVKLSIGENEGDPVFTITDLLPHLGADQMKKTAAEVIEGEELNVLIGSMPFPGGEDVKERFKLGVLNLLYEQYGITERDLVTAEIEIVPATKARCVGFDRSMVGGYGQDDRVCAYTALRALLDAETPLKRTGMVILYDKEETGSGGITGARSQLFPSIQRRMVRAMLGREPSAIELQDQIEKSTMLSSDVSNAYDPTFASVSDPKNNTYAGRGIAFFKYTGARGKGGTSDANAEYFNEVTRLLDEHDVPWQTGELGRVDQGGGGTVAIYQADLGISVIDCGVPVLSMHSCFEVTSKIDVYKTYVAYKVFLEHMRS